MRSAAFALGMDLTATSYVYPLVTGDGNDPYGPARRGNGPGKTTGSSTTVVSAVASGAAFKDVAVGDILYFRKEPVGATLTRICTAKASDDSITVNTAIDLDRTAGYFYTWKHQAAGNAATDGWIDVSGAGPNGSTIQVEWAVKNATSLEVQAEGRMKGTGAGVLLPEVSMTAAGSEFLPIPEKIASVRLGHKVTTDTGVNTVNSAVSY